MRIRNRLTIIYTSIVAVILICLNLFIYSFTSLHIKNDFYSSLKQRANITSQKFFEKDELEISVFKEIERKFLRSIPDETINIYDSQNHPLLPNNPSNVSEDIIEKIRKEKHIEYEENQKQYVGIFYPDNEGNFVIVVSAVDKTGIDRIQNLKELLIIGFLISLVIVCVTGRFFSKQALNPMSEIIKEVNKISASNLHLRVNEGNGKDEIAELAITFNHMLERLETAFEVERDFVHNASHELRTPLTSIIGEMEVILTKDRPSEEYKETMRSILIEAEKLNKLTTDLLDLAKVDSDHSKFKDIYIDDILWEAKTFVEKQVPGRNIKIQHVNIPKEDSANLIIKGNEHLMKMAISNILENACKFSDNKEVNAILEFGEGEVRLNIVDQGIGIPEKDIQNIFEPFYRASNVKNYQGSGIGLALTKKIIHLHKGTIHIRSNINNGTIVDLIFPKLKL